jgi:hypothetical protein
MSVVDFAETLRELLEDKINECRRDLHESNTHIDKDRLLIEIWALEWVPGRINLVNKGRKENNYVIK